MNHKMKIPDPEDEDYEVRKENYKPQPQLEKLVQLLKGNTGLIFSNGDLSEVKKLIDA